MVRFDMMRCVECSGLLTDEEEAKGNLCAVCLESDEVGDVSEYDFNDDEMDAGDDF